MKTLRIPLQHTANPQPEMRQVEQEQVDDRCPQRAVEGQEQGHASCQRTNSSPEECIADGRIGSHDHFLEILHADRLFLALTASLLQVEDGPEDRRSHRNNFV